MSNVIDFLEKLGGDAQLREASAEKLEEALAQAGLDEDVRLAIVNGDQHSLEALLGADSNVCCMVFKEDEEEEEEEQEGEEEEEEGDDDEKAHLDGQPVPRRAARVA